MPDFVQTYRSERLASVRHKVGLATGRVILAAIVSILCPVFIANAMAKVDVVDLGGGQYQVRFSYSPGKEIKTVSVCGSFNGWDRDARLDGPDDDGVYSKTIVLRGGDHEYKFFVDGHEWVADPDNPNRSGPFGNSLLTLGRGDATGTGLQSSSTATMARTVANPGAVIALAEKVTVAKDDWKSVLDDWFAKNSQPLIDDSSVAFVFAGADDVDLEIRATGVRQSYSMERLTAALPIFAVTLDRRELPDGAVYLFAVMRESKTRIVVDPNARSHTSRSNQPVGMIAEPSPKRGRIVVHQNVAPADSGLRPRDVYVYLPPGYADTTDRYPVLYMHDGQNCWDDPAEPFGHGGWNVNGIADKLIDEGVVEPFIVVGVANTPDRLKDYGTGADITDGDGHAYIRFLTDELRPLIDKTYRTRTDSGDTAVMGSSMGGSISLQAALLEPNVLGKAACISPAFLFADDQGHGHEDLIRAVGKVNVRLYIDHGTAGPSQDGAQRTQAVVELLREAGWRDGSKFEYYVDQGAEHNERAWRARLDRPLRFLFGRKPEADR